MFRMHKAQESGPRFVSFSLDACVGGFFWGEDGGKNKVACGGWWGNGKRVRRGDGSFEGHSPLEMELEGGS